MKLGELDPNICLGCGAHPDHCQCGFGRFMDREYPYWRSIRLSDESGQKFIDGLRAAYEAGAREAEATKERLWEEATDHMVTADAARREAVQWQAKYEALAAEVRRHIGTEHHADADAHYLRWKIGGGLAAAPAIAAALREGGG